MAIISDKYVVYDAPSNSQAFGRTSGSTVNGAGKQWVSLGYKINYTVQCGEQSAKCGEQSAKCGEYSGFTQI